MTHNGHTVVRRHPLCTGPGCTWCGQLDAEQRGRVSDMRRRVDALDEPDRLRLLDSILQANPDVVGEALVETGAWVPERHEWDE